MTRDTSGYEGTVEVSSSWNVGDPGWVAFAIALALCTLPASRTLARQGPESSGTPFT